MYSKVKDNKEPTKKYLYPNNKKQSTINVYAIINVPQVFVDIETHQVRPG